MPMVIDENGVTVQTIDEVRTEMFNRIREPSPDGFGPDFLLEDEEIIPTCFTIWAEREAHIQNMIAAAVSTRVPGEAEGVHADDIAGITGTERLPPSRSTVEALLTGTASAVIPTGRVARHNPTGTLWMTTEAVTLDGSGEGTTILQSQEFGSFDITAGTDWTIILGDSNLTAVESTADSQLGRLEETDEELEARRQEELGAGGTSTARAIRGDVQQTLQDAGYEVDAIDVFVNFTEDYDEDGRPPGSVEVLIDDNNIVPNAVIGLAIWNAVGGGIQPYGTTLVTITDDFGVTRSGIGFSRATQVEMYVRATLSTAGAETLITDPAALIDELESVLAAFGDASHPAGRDVIPGVFQGSVFNTAPGGSVISVLVEVSDDGVAWQSTPYAINDRQQAVFDASRVTVVIA
jgi:hypothetical protein